MKFELLGVIERSEAELCRSGEGRNRNKWLSGLDHADEGEASPHVHSAESILRRVLA